MPRSSGANVAEPDTVRPTWSSWAEAVRVVCYPAHLRKTVAVAAVVGTVLFAINHLDVVVRGQANAVVWLKMALTYLVPFTVSNYGILIATHRPAKPAKPEEPLNRPGGP
jgi:hypothetical protein